jgi:hypothetical protein
MNGLKRRPSKKKTPREMRVAGAFWMRRAWLMAGRLQNRSVTSWLILANSISCNPALAGGDRMHWDQLKRREFITLLGGDSAARRRGDRIDETAWGHHASQRRGSLARRARSSRPSRWLVFSTAHRSTPSRVTCAPFASRRQVAVIAATGSASAAFAAKAATTTIPITRVAVLANPANAAHTETTSTDVEVAACAIGLQIQIVNASTSREIDATFE